MFNCISWLNGVNLKTYLSSYLAVHGDHILDRSLEVCRSIITLQSIPTPRNEQRLQSLNGKKHRLESHVEKYLE